MKKRRQNQQVPASIQCQAELHAWLAAQGIDATGWGLGPTKSVENLWGEVEKGEIFLLDNPPLRVVQVVQVIVRRGDRILIEIEQEFADNRRRERHYPPSEKMAAGESYTEAALRCMKEELAVERHQIELLAATYQQRATEKDSLSYPGLRSRYMFHMVEARVSGLPSTSFCTIEDSATPLDPVRKHHWVWQREDEAAWPD